MKNKNRKDTYNQVRVNAAQRSKLVGGVDPMMISCWACLCNDLLETVKKVTTLTVSQICNYLLTRADEVLQAIKDFRTANIDSNVPISPCPAKFLLPLLKAHYPDNCRKELPEVPDKLPGRSPSSVTLSEALEAALGEETAAADETNEEFEAPMVQANGSPGSNQDCQASKDIAAADVHDVPVPRSRVRVAMKRPAVATNQPSKSRQKRVR